MTRVFLATPENCRREIPTLTKATTKDLRFAIRIFGATAYAVTVNVGDFPIILFSLREEDTVRVLVHEEGHRVLLTIGELPASMAFDHPNVKRLIEGRRTTRSYRRAYRRFEAERASLRTEAR